MIDNILSSTEGPIAQACRMLLREGMSDVRNLLSRGMEPKPWPDHFEHVMLYVKNLERAAHLQPAAPVVLPMALPLDSGPINPSRPHDWWGEECSGCTLPRRDCECN